MNSIETLLHTFPDELGAADLATAIACSLEEAEQIFADGLLYAHRVNGVWMISKQSLAAQLLALRTPANAA